MREAIFIAVVATLLIAAAVEVVAAGVKTVTTRSHFYSAPAGGIGVAVPDNNNTFPTDILPQ